MILTLDKLDHLRELLGPGIGISLFRPLDLDIQHGFGLKALPFCLVCPAPFNYVRIQVRCDRTTLTLGIRVFPRSLFPSCTNVYSVVL
jgi:hypothetical protein